MTIRTDQRKLETRPQPLLDRAAREAWLPALEHELMLAELFSGILESGEYSEQGSASLVEYARRLGHHGARAIVQARLGQAIRVCPELADRLRAKTVPIESAETIAAVIADPATRELENWLELAEKCELRALQDLVRLRREEAKREGERLRTVPVFLTDREVNKVRRVREIASQRAGQQLTDSQGIVVALDEYLERWDPERRAKRAKLSSAARTKTEAGLEDAPNTTRVRHIPKAIEHRIRDRAGHCCEVPGCGATTRLELCHRRWWSTGGAHSVENIVLLCHRHHVMFDAGHITCLGFAVCGRPIFRLPDGEVLLPKPTGPPE